MPETPIFRPELVTSYDRPGPRYTSYPPATQFSQSIDGVDYRDWVRQSNEEPIPNALSLYFHIPFCSSICYYCACNKVITKNRQAAEDYLSDLFDEIEIQSQLFDPDREVKQLHWGGGTPGFLSHRQMQQLMAHIKANFRLPNDDQGDISIEIDPRVVVKGGLFLLRNLGFNRISIGVQDFDEKVQIAVNRRQPIEITAAVMDEARRARFKSVNFDLIYGLPLQNPQSFSTTLDSVIDLDPDRIALYNYAHLPSRFPPQRRIRVEDLPVAEDRLAILGIAIEKLGAAGYNYIGMDHFAKPTDDLALAQRNGTLQRNFQGYSSQARCDTIGMGISAISQIGDHFSQNTLDLKQYHEMLSERKIPLVRGYRSNADDRLRREIIQQLICHFRLDTRRLENLWNIDFADYFAAELKALGSMQRDGLVELGKDEIQVSASGRILIRNICMIFDRYIQGQDSGGNFSRTI